MRSGTTTLIATMRWSLLVAAACSGFWQEEAVAASGGVSGPADFFVSPQGRDTWSGKRADPGEDDGPFATVARARDAVRELLGTQKEPRRVRVILRGGTYTSTLRWRSVGGFGNGQAPVVYGAAVGKEWC
jgi:hypothetical protein